METEGYIGVRRDVDMDMKEQDGINLIDKVIADDNLWSAYKKVRKNKGAPGMDGITVYQLKGTYGEILSTLNRKLKDGTYQPQPVKRVAIPKPDGSKRNLGIPMCPRQSSATSNSSSH